MSARLDSFLDDYLSAWESNDPEDVRALFTEDAVYHPDPWGEGWRGVDEIVDNWLDRQDDPGTWEFEWSVLVEQGDLAIIEGETRYDDGPTYSNLWIIRFAPDGRAYEFTEWWQDQADPS